MQHAIASLWASASTLPTDTHRTAQRINALIDTISESVAQLEGLRLHLIQEAKLCTADAVIDHVRGSVRMAPAQATATLRLAADLGNRFPIIADALTDGAISLAQADAIVTGLRRLPTRYTRHDLARCQHEILRFVDELDPAGLRTLAAHLTELIDPDAAELDEARRLAREEHDAHRNRSFRLAPDHHGSVRLSGQLPVADAALLSAQLEALLPPASAYAHTGETPGRDARRADALVLLTHTAANSATLPTRGTDRPRVHITLNHDTLITGLGHADVLDIPGIDTLPASAARRLACDAHLIPIVLGSASQPMDVGRADRLFTAAIRAALTERDKGCAFPGCEATPVQCHAHHIIPWCDDGPTELGNGVLLCPYHHRLVEPDPLLSPEDQWSVHIDPGTGMPWFTPPRHTDPDRQPIQHRRHKAQRIHHTLRSQATTPHRETPDARGHEGPPRPAVGRWESAPCPNPWHPDRPPTQPRLDPWIPSAQTAAPSGLSGREDAQRDGG